MPAKALDARPSACRLREARRRLVDSGECASGLLDPVVAASWQRSRGFGLVPDGRVAGAPHASGAQLARALEHRGSLVAHARPVMDFLAQQIADTGSLVILADSQGMLLHSLGDVGFADKAARVALRPGAIWLEQWRGTNAIGTALADRRPVVVQGGEHYLERNGFLTCAASPIVDPTGQLLGVLDISGDHRGHHRHTLALVRSAARMVEHRLFEARHGQGLQLRLHTQPEGLGTVTEGLAALDADGRIVGADASALALLGLAQADIGRVDLDQLLAVDLAQCLAQAGRPRAVCRHDGQALWLRLDVGRAAALAPRVSARPLAEAGPPAARGPATHDALAALDTGDAAMQAVIGRARRVIDKPIALLLQGESGVGKEVFARACHASGARHDKPFVAVNCAALPDTLIEAELFGYRPGAFTGASRDGAPGRIREAHGGTLFLDEIGDMPLAMQARLLRVLQERQVVPLGGGRPVPVDFRLVCATHRRLREEVDAGRFREDLYYRVNGLALTLPPLRERSDLPALVERMLAAQGADPALSLSPALLAGFARHRWPGNLRQLANVLATACALVEEGEPTIELRHLPDDIAEELSGAGTPRREPVEPGDLRLQTERCVRQAVGASGGNLSEAARQLGISRNTLYRKLRVLERVD
jgi:transcriptional regulator of acetoin/glycerol metabolism